MKLKPFYAGMALAAISLPALAQAPRPSNWMDMTVGKEQGSGCDEMSWNLRRDAQNEIRGVIWYTGGAGVSSATGTADADGKFTIKVTPIYGNGPNGTITGQRMKDGSVDAELKGPVCSTGMIHLKAGATSTQ